MENIDWFSLIAGTLGGLVFFLYGMSQMSAGLKSGLGDKIRTLLTKLNGNRFTMMLTGIAVTTITQSTGATTVMLMSFVETNIMQFAATIPVILGACIGSSVTSQIIAFDIAGYAIIPVIIGYFMKTSSKDNIRDTGNAIFGFGLVFFGMQYLGKSVSILKDIPEFTNLIASASNPFLGVLVGTIATCIMQSTGMFAGILMVFTKEGLMDIHHAYPLVIGSTIGTCLLIIIASAGTSVASKRTMAAHVLTKLVGAAIFLCLTKPCTDFLEWLCNTLQVTPERSIANVHLFFNVGEALTLLPFTQVFVNVIEKLIPESNEKITTPHLRYIDFNVITMPQSAIELSISETATLIKLTSRMFKNAVEPFIDFKPDKSSITKQEIKQTIDNIDIKESKFDYIEEEIRKYLFSVGRRDNAQTITRQIFAIISVLEQTARIGDIIRRSLVPMYDKLSVLRITFSVEGMSEIKLHTWEINNHFNNLITAIEERNHKLLLRTASELELTKHNADQLRISHIKRLWSADPNVRMTHEIHTELIDDLTDIADIILSITNTFHQEIVN